MTKRNKDGVRPRLSGAALERVTIARIEAWQRVAVATIRAAFGLGACYFLYRATGELAGKETSLSTAMKAMVDMKLSEYASLALAGVFGTGYGIERRLRKRAVAEMSEHARTLEERLDPNRTSSGLSINGQPPKQLRGM